MVHTRPFLMMLTYIISVVAPPGATTSLMGLVSVPLRYWPYALLAMDFLMGGPQAVASSISGLVVGHLWWWGVWGTDADRARGQGGFLLGVASAPMWLKKLFGEERAPGGAPGTETRNATSILAAGGSGTAAHGEASGGVHVFAPRNRPLGGSSGSSTSTTTGYNWGSGTRLGNS